MFSKHMFLLSALLIGVFALFIVGCDTADKSVNPDSIAYNDDSQTHDPPNDAELVVTDTLIDYTEEVRAIAPWLLEGNNGVAYRLHTDARTAVWMEALYALCGPDNKVGKAIGGMAAGDNNYYATDISAYNYIKSRYGTAYASVWGLYFSNIYSYALYGGFGRGGQCRGFANLIWYRSTSWHNTLYTYQTFVNDYAKPSSQRRWTKPYNQARRGDIIQYAKNGKYHTAVVVAILGGTEGSSVYSVDVIDANWVGGDGQEIIGRHPISRITSGSSNGGISDLDQYIVIDCLKAGVQ